MIPKLKTKEHLSFVDISNIYPDIAYDELNVINTEITLLKNFQSI